MSDPLIATQADYADALLTSRLAKNWCFLILLLLLLGQIGLFLVSRYTKFDLHTPTRTLDMVHYAVGMTGFFALGTTLIYAVMLLLMINVMVVGRLLGVGKITAAFVWCVLLMVIVFPWQAFLNYASLTGADFKIPGAIYTWDELVNSSRFGMGDDSGSYTIGQAVLKWSRFIGFPVVAILINIMIQAKSAKGLRRALGEEAILTDNNVVALRA